MILVPQKVGACLIVAALFAACSSSNADAPKAARNSSWEVAPLQVPLDCMPRELWQDPASGKIGVGLVEVSYSKGCACDGPGRAAASPDVAASIRAYLKENVACSPNACEAACVCSIVVASDHVSCQNDVDTTAVGWCYLDTARRLGTPGLLTPCPDGGTRGIRFVGGAEPRSDQELYSVAPYCTAVGCEDGVYWMGDVPLSPSKANHLTITLCQNDVCASGARTLTRVGKDDWQVKAGGGLPGDCVPAERDGATSLDCELPIPAPKLAGGEHYTLTIVDDDTGLTLVSADRTFAAYEEYFPNGPSCGPPCLSGNLN